MIFSLINISIILIIAILSILNQFFAIEYLFNQNIEVIYISWLIKGSIILFYLISLFYVILMVMTFGTLDDKEISEMDQEEYEYSISHFLIEKLGYFSLILSVILYYILSCSKLITLVHIKQICSTNGLYFGYFKSHIAYYSTLIQIIFMTIPQIFLQIWNNLSIEEDIHDPHARGIINISTFTGVLYILLHFILVQLALGKEDSTVYSRKRITNEQIENTLII